MKDTEILRLFREGLNYAELAARAGYHVSQVQPIYDALDRCRGPIPPKLPVGRTCARVCRPVGHFSGGVVGAGEGC